MARKASCSECCGGGGSLEAARGKAAAAEEEVAMTAGAEVRRALPLEGAVETYLYDLYDLRTEREEQIK